MNHLMETGSKAGPWNKGKLVGQKAPLRLKDIWAIRIRLQLGNRIRELALFNLAIDSKLRSCAVLHFVIRQSRRAAIQLIRTQNRFQWTLY
jgi:hypothetical protein